MEQVHLMENLNVSFPRLAATVRYQTITLSGVTEAGSTSDAFNVGFLGYWNFNLDLALSGVGGAGGLTIALLASVDGTTYRVVPGHTYTFLFADTGIILPIRDFEHPDCKIYAVSGSAATDWGITAKVLMVEYGATESSSAW